jgi:general secretion pathway protein L
VNTLYIRLPPRAVADSAPHLLALACPFALVSDDGEIEREGVEPLSNMSATITRMQRVVVLLGGSNVTILRVQVPPLSASRLKAALPNLVEEQLLCDPAECVIVAGGLSDGLRTIAVVQRAWLELLAKVFIALGARHIVALPAQLCLPYQSGQKGQSDQPDSVTAAINAWATNIDMTLRLSEQDGIGLVISVDQNESAASVAIRTLCAVVPEAPITLYVPQSAAHAYQEAAALNKRINVFADNWSHWITGARVTTIDLMAGLGAGTNPKMDLHPWRWPLALAAAVLLINAAVLNIDWWHMKEETNALHTVMTQIYKSAYPKESVIIDPLAQMQQKIASAKRDLGVAAPDDFTAITATFGEAWASIAPKAGKEPATISALEYREHSLFVHLTPSSEAPTQEIKAALAKRDLALELAPEQAGTVVWKIGSAK